MNMQRRFGRAATATRESKYVDFKAQFDPASVGEWCEIVKDIVSMANSGGGVIVFGVENDGNHSKMDVESVLKCDPAKVTDKIAKYTGVQFDGFEIQEVRRGGKKVAAFVVAEATVPMVFTKAGTYRDGSGKEKIAFQQGTIYFRHGAKSEPATRGDLERVINREVERTRRSWLSGIRKVTKAPRGHVVEVVGPGVRKEIEELPARIVGDPRAPAIRPAEADSIWPYRGKDVIHRVNERLEGRARINSHDLLCVRRAHGIDKLPEFIYKPFKLTSPQYSEAYVTWLVEQYERDQLFFAKARREYTQRRS